MVTLDQLKEGDRVNVEVVYTTDLSGHYIQPESDINNQKIPVDKLPADHKSGNIFRVKAQVLEAEENPIKVKFDFYPISISVLLQDIVLIDG